MMPHPSAIDRLARLDARLRERLGPLRSLCPERALATTLAAMGERWLTGDVPAAVAEGFSAALADIIAAEAHNFPETLFWDFDLPARRLFEVASEDAPSASRRLAQSRDVLVRLQERFGIHSRIRFRYVHDFVYGFDWAKWVRRGGAQRRGVGPFDPPFLEYTLGRGEELLRLIDRNDATYPEIEAGQARNPFGFSRAPPDEKRLLRDLAERDLLPVKAWDPDSVPRWDLPFAALREERARALGL